MSHSNSCRCALVVAAGLIGLAAACVTSNCSAAIIAYEGFDYADGDLRNESGGEGEWVSPWFSGQGFGTGDTWQVALPSLSYTDSGGRTLPTAGGAASADDGSAGNKEFREARTWDSFDDNDDGDVLWFSFLFNRTSENTTGNHIWILGDAGLSSGIGVFINPTNIGARIQVNSTVHSAGHKSFAVGEDHLVVGRITFSDLLDDEVRFWLDPELNAIPLDTAPNSGAVSAALDQTNKNVLYVRQFNSPGVTLIDEIRIGTDFFSVVGVPEPSSLALSMLAGIGTLFRRARPVTLLLLACAGTQPAAAAVVHTRIELAANSNPIIGDQQPNFMVKEQTVQDPVGSLQDHLQAGSGLAGSAARVVVGLGGMRMNAFSDAVADESYIFSGSSISAFGSFADELTITSPTVANGQAGTATFAVHVEGFLAHGFVSGNTSAVARLTLILNGSTTTFLSYDTDYIDEVFEFDVNFVYGDPFTIDVGTETYASAEASAGAAIGSSAFGEADFGNTLEWAGVVTIVDELGQDVSAYTMSSASGTDYRNPIQAPPVPEPASWALIVLMTVPGYRILRPCSIR